MPFIPNTPESLIGRSDSKNPDTTCRGITAGGRPCRRPLAASPSASPAPPPRNRLAAPLRADDPADPDLYCWQHKDQASSSAKSSPGPRLSSKPILESRESIDTLFDRLGIVEAAQRRQQQKQHQHQQKLKHGSRVNGQLPTKPGHGQGRYSGSQFSAAAASSHPAHHNSKKKKQKTVCCCFRAIDSGSHDNEPRPVRPKPRPLQPAANKPASAPLPPASGRLTAPSPAAGSRRPSVTSASKQRQTSGQSHVSQTSEYLSLVPPSASPQTASLLLAELAKPVSPQDEPGYIYIFWLTPESQVSAPPADAARDLLAPPSPAARPRSRRPSDVLETFATGEQSPRGRTNNGGGGGGGGGSKKTILLKIGRASNVQRRLNEWSRQCGHHLTLIRYYPYVSTSRPSTPRKLPHSHKVERLVQLELAGAGLRVSDRESWACDSCGRAHREWFEVEATRRGVAMVDDVVRRWSDWDERTGDT